MFTTKRNNLVAKGGIMQEGGTVDEASGNDVPPGSLKEEVRDDVDAKLSVGEYVFPADVTRYYGLAKLEEMRKEAQANLKQMESGGRMGNSEQVSEEASDEYDDKEFSGAVDQAMQEQDGENGYAEGGMVKSYDVGGAVTYDPAVSKETYKRAPLKGFEMIPMSDDKGNTIYIPFINGKPQLNIPPGFAIRAAAPKAETPTTDSTTPTAPAADQPRGGGGDRADRNAATGNSGYSPSVPTGSVSFAQQAVDAAPAIGKAISLVNPIAGIAISQLAKAYAPEAAKAELSAIGSLVSKSESEGGQSFAGGNYGKSVSDGGYGVTSRTGALYAANPMGVDPATAQGQQAIVAQANQLAVDKNISPNDALASILGDSDFSAAISGQDAANARDSVDTGVTVGPAISTPNTSPTTLGPADGISNGRGGGEGGGAATGGQGGDASGGGDRGTRGGFAKGGLVSRRNK